MDTTTQARLHHYKALLDTHPYTYIGLYFPQTLKILIIIILSQYNRREIEKIVATHDHESIYDCNPETEA